MYRGDFLNVENLLRTFLLTNKIFMYLYHDLLLHNLLCLKVQLLDLHESSEKSGDFWFIVIYFVYLEHGTINTRNIRSW